MRRDYACATRDGSWVLIAANSEPIFARLMRLVGREDLIGAAGYDNNAARVGNVAVLDALITAWSSQHEADTLLDLLEQADIPASKAYTAADCAADEQYRARGMVRAVFDPALGREMLHAGIVPHIPESPGTVRWTGPEIGEHTDTILAELGHEPEAIAKMRREGII